MEVLEWLLVGMCALAAVETFSLYLGLFVSRKRARMAAPLVLYPMLWNYAIASRMYFVYDLATIAFFAGGLVLLHRKSLERLNVPLRSLRHLEPLLVLLLHDPQSSYKFAIHISAIVAAHQWHTCSFVHCPQV